MSMCAVSMSSLLVIESVFFFESICLYRAVVGVLFFLFFLFKKNS